MSSWDPAEALLLADRMALLSHGSTLQMGVPDEIMRRPATEEAARLIGLRNLFDAEVVDHVRDTPCTLIRFGAYLLETGRVVISGSAEAIRNDEAVRRSYLGY